MRACVRAVRPSLLASGIPSPCPPRGSHLPLRRLFGASCVARLAPSIGRAGDVCGSIGGPFAMHSGGGSALSLRT
eukprot:5387887-Alexandrium_andersonii.AAC.1